MGRITTVLGTIPSPELGFCQSHEHLSIAGGYPVAVHPDQCIDDPGKSAEELALYRRAGGEALVDAQPLGCGRDAVMLRKISEQSGVRIIASTGFHKMIFYPRGHWIYSIDADDLTEIYTAELTQGMFTDGDTRYPETRSSIRSGQIKAALDGGEFSLQYEKLFSAAAEAAKVTGAALMVHVEKGSDPIALSDFLLRRGVSLDRVIFCHLDRMVEDLGVHREICGRSIYLEYDTIGRPKYHDDEEETRIILAMLEAGYEKQLLMSLDTTRGRLHSYGGMPGLDHILRFFIPLLRKHGVSEEQIKLFFTQNPAHVFAC
jgi:phosphotriesterase-related protein